MQTFKNRRSVSERRLEAEHAPLDSLKESLRGHGYLFNNIPPYPRPEFHLKHLKHETNPSGLSGICEDGGFKDPHGGSKHLDQLPLVWFSLAVQPEDIESAETRLLEKEFPDRTEEQAARQESFLGKFATSPAFTKKSRYGPYRFTFLLEEVLKAYSEQCCSGEDPVFRVLQTSLYKAEVLYAVLVHSPDDNERFSAYPELRAVTNAVCAYRDGSFIWRPEAMCGKHSYKLNKDSEEQLMEAEDVTHQFWHQFYVWDHVALALHVENGKVLKFDELKEHVDVCEEDEVQINGPSDSGDPEALIERLWPTGTPPSIVEKLAELSVHENPKQEETQPEAL